MDGEAAGDACFRDYGGAACILEYVGGALGNLHLTASGASQPHERYTAFGGNWWAAIEDSNRVIFQRGIPFSYGGTTTFAPEGLDHGAIVWEPQNNMATLENKSFFTQGFYDELKHFCDCIIEKKKPAKGSLEFALDVMKVYEATITSQGNRVVLN